MLLSLNVLCNSCFSWWRIERTTKIITFWFCKVTKTKFLSTRSWEWKHERGYSKNIRHLNFLKIIVYEFISNQARCQSELTGEAEPREWNNSRFFSDFSSRKLLSPRWVSSCNFNENRKKQDTAPQPEICLILHVDIKHEPIDFIVYTFSSKNPTNKSLEIVE